MTPLQPTNEVVDNLCPDCDHPVHAPGKCEFELGDGYRGAEFEEALGPCACGVTR